MATVTDLNQLLDQHVVLDLQCLDRIYLNAYVPTLQVGGQVVTFVTQHSRLPHPLAGPVRQHRRPLPQCRQGLRPPPPHPT